MARIWAKVLRSIRRTLGAQAPASMTCRQFEDFIVSYLDGSLDKDVSREFENHIDACKACRQYLAAYRETIVIGRRVYDDVDEIPDTVPEDLVLAVLKARFSS
ncbi:MAG: anti-sigma factor family protein [bacterium]